MAKPQACVVGNPFVAVSLLVIAASAGLASGCDDNSAPAGSTEADAGGHTSHSAIDAQVTIPDLHADPDELEGGARLCAVLRNACHPFDKGAGDLADRCHDWGHEGAADVCAEHYDDCIAVCSHVDAGHVHDAGVPHANQSDAADAGRSPMPIELEDHDTLPGVELTLSRDAVSGWNLHADLERFNLAPERLSGEHVLGEGHMHLFVNGVKYTEVYTPWFHLPELSNGEHEVRLELVANSHNLLTHHHEPIGDTVIITQDDSIGVDAGLDGPALVEVDGDNAPSVSLRLHDDEVAGWNIELTTEDFVFAPEFASSPHVPGQGYVSLYIDGVYHARLYGNWFHVSHLNQGRHIMSVRLNANDHRTYSVAGDPIEFFFGIDVDIDVATSQDAGIALDGSQAAP